MGFARTLSSRDNQENVTSNNAKNVDDLSLRGKKLRSVSNAMLGVNGLGIFGGEFLLWKRSPGLLNSKVCEFKNQTYTCSYRLPKEDSAFKTWDKEIVPFKVMYKPSVNKLYIVMPVMFMRPTNLNDGKDPIDSGSPEGRKSSKPTTEFKEAYKSSVHQMWSGRHKLYLDAVNPEKNELCETWADIGPVDVDVSVEESPNKSKSYKIYFVNSRYRDNTGPDRVIFSKGALERVTNNETDKQNVFAHEFGHQIGLGDEYPIDYYKAEYANKKTIIKGVYWNHILKAYERTEGERSYELPKEGRLFNHDGVDYEAKKMTFEKDGQSVSGYVLKEFNSGNELETPLKGLKSDNPVEAPDSNGKMHKAVYLYDTLKADEKPGLRTYDLKNIRRRGARIYHNGEKYSVHKHLNPDGYAFYYLVSQDTGKRTGTWLDGTFTTHTEMVAREFGEDYAMKYATTHDYTKPYVNCSMMNVGNDVRPHHYIPFKYGMVEAIRTNYHDSIPSEEAPNMNEDWKIE